MEYTYAKNVIPAVCGAALLFIACQSYAFTNGVAPDTVLIHGVDDYVTASDAKAGVVVSDREVMRVALPHELHEKAGVQCVACHHKKYNDDRIKECAVCHKGKAGIDSMHAGCISCHEKKNAGPVTCEGCHTQPNRTALGIIRFDLYDVVRGPCLWITLVVFVCGCIFRIIQFTRFTRKIRETGAPFVKPVVAADSMLLAGRSAMGKLLIRLRFRIKGTMLGSNPVMSAVSMVFHVLLFLAPLLAVGHNVLFDEAFRISFFTLPEPLIDKFTVAIMVIGGFFLLRRMFIPRVRMITTIRDYGIIALVFAPFITGYLAYHQIFDYRMVLLSHMIIGEIAIMAIPFTRLGHMPFIFLARYLIDGEYNFGRANRRWAR